MTIIQMQYFKAVCDTGSFTKAAELMHISQPAISSAIKQLESECDTVLFERKNNALTLTEAGAILLDEIAKFLTHYRRLNHVTRDLQLARNFVRIGLSTLSGTQVYPEILNHYKSRHPDIRVYSVEESTHRQFELLDNGELDFIITIRHYVNEATRKAFNEVYEHIPLKESRLVFCVSKEYPLPDSEEISLSRIAEVPLVMLSDNFNQARRLKKLFEENALVPNILHQTSQMYTVERFVEQGGCGGFLPEVVVAQNARLKGYVYESSRGLIELFWRKKAYQFYAEREFLYSALQVSKLS